MTNPKSRMFAAVAGALSMGAVAAWAVEPSPTDVKIQELQAKVAQLESRQAANSKDMAATIDSVLRDAEKRSQLLANSGEMGAGYDNGFYIKAGDAWVMRPGVLFQFWNVTDYRTHAGVNSKDTLDNGFEVHKLWFQLEGTAFTKDLTYSFIWDTASNGGGMYLLDAWAKYMFADDWGVRMGQFSDPVSHEYLTYDGFLMAAERSMLDRWLGGGATGRVQGASLIYGNYNAKNPLNAELAFTDGAQSGNTDFTKDGRSNFGIAGRVEYKAMGSWLNYRDFSAMGNKEDLLVFGGGFDWTQSGDNTLIGTLDAQYETASGWSFYGAGLIRYGDHVSASLDGLDTDSRTDWGLLGQVAYMLNPSWEVFGRVDYLKPDGKTLAPVYGEENQFWELTVGVNYFLGSNGSAGHRAKFTVDLTWLPDGSPAVFGTTSIGAADETSGQNEFMLRAQFQLLI